MSKQLLTTDGTLESADKRWVQAEHSSLPLPAVTYLPLIALAIAILLHVLIPNKQSFTNVKHYLTVLELLTAIYIILLLASIKLTKLRKVLTEKAPLWAAAFIILTIWDLITLKYRLLPLPYFPEPDKILNAFSADKSLLALSTVYSVRLLFTGYILGAVVGLVTGIMIGWSKKWNYWISPLIRIIGPIPATAWIPIALIVFPTSFWASVFLISLAVWFPVTVMSSSGIENVRNSYLEVARTLGANERYLIFKVALPAASHTIFIGLFMGLGISFVTLIVAEMLGVKAGLGWYITWAQGWADYSKVYASLLVIAVIFSGIINLFFRAKDKVLVWQRGLIKW
ncbi:MAG: ABC transporter permease subunit [Syntrophomonadaceae bacterium]|nr:ABC transporter permease subunit [Syntrophomonadaceae bacterium]